MDIILLLITNILLTFMGVCIIIVLFVKSQKNREKKQKNDLVESAVKTQTFKDILEYRMVKSKSSLILYGIDISEIYMLERYMGETEGMVKDEMVTRLNNVISDEGLVTIIKDYIVIQDKIEQNTCAIKEQLEKMVHTMSEPYIIKGNEYNITTYIGCVPLESGQERVETLFKRLINMTKKSKASGEKYVIYNNQGKEERISYLDLEKGIEKDEFRLVYQPQKDTKNNKVIGVEGLVRWEHTKKGNISPDQFIGVAERTGLIQELGYHIIGMAIRDYKKWGNPDYMVSINISLKQFEDVNLVTNVRRILEREEVNPKNIKLEITETVGIDDISFIRETLKELKELGFKIALDDFGKGYSSLSYLKELPLDTIKIDKVFVDNLEERPSDRRFLENLVTFLNAIEIDIIVEGVETKEQLELLQGMGCMQIQGYYISKPVESDKLGEVIEKLEKVG